MEEQLRKSFNTEKKNWHEKHYLINIWKSQYIPQFWKLIIGSVQTTFANTADKMRGFLKQYRDHILPQALSHCSSENCVKLAYHFCHVLVHFGPLKQSQNSITLVNEKNTGGLIIRNQIKVIEFQCSGVLHVHEGCLSLMVRFP